ncbi:MAG: HAD family phosphatase [Spirochaetaceae bacterium]|jgi:HAD superfamily hydrolase (TIGR01509 family)|nr:HAD family phosphatase [Spirochaetaceae bacterium]
MTTTPFLPGGVIFDLDGLMLDTERPMVNAWVTAARNKGWLMEETVAFKTIGLDEASSRAIVTAALGPDFPYEQIRKDLISLVIRDAETHGIARRPGLMTLLDHLTRLGVPLGVATSSKGETARWKLRHGGILDRFPVLVCGDEVDRGKPAPDIFLLAAERLGKAPAECVGFEDSPAGLMSLRAAGIRSVFVKDLVEPPPEVLASVWRRCGDLAEAAALFG